ncbi:MAG: hypothetical protein PHO57_07345 [Acidithiobacillus sp.]|nr:hypothetical protein [Acidithiobacillus sp.]
MVEQDRAWEAQTSPLLIRVLQNRFGGQIVPANQTDDMFHGTDFLWSINGSRFRLAMRVRRPGFLQYRDDFTIREDRPRTGHRTELEKIRAGDWAHIYAYAFSNGKDILYWSLFRMSRFRPDAPFHYMPGYGPDDKNDTVTRIYRIADQPAGFVLATASAIPDNRKQQRNAA